MEILYNPLLALTIVFVIFIMCFQHGLRGIFRGEIRISTGRGASEMKFGNRAKVWGAIYILFSFVFLALAIYIYWTITHPITYRTIVPK